MPRVWRFKDGKAGHERQTAGLLRALQARTRVDVFEIDTRELDRAWLGRVMPNFPEDAGPPDLLIGAGSACQWPMLTARRIHGGRRGFHLGNGLRGRWLLGAGG